jgi:hypothetical protein
MDRVAVFFLSVLLAVLALLVRFAHDAIPVVSNYRNLSVRTCDLRRQAILQTLFVSITESFDEGGFEAVNIEHFSV